MVYNMNKTSEPIQLSRSRGRRPVHSRKLYQTIPLHPPDPSLGEAPDRFFGQPAIGRGWQPAQSSQGTLKQIPVHPNPLHHFPQPPGPATYATNTSPPDTFPTDATQHLSTGSTKPAPQHSYHSTTKNTGPAPSTHKTPPQPSSKQIRTHLNVLHPAHHNTKPSKQLKTPFKHNPQLTTHKI